MHDIIIVGGGPAGLTAALYALRAGKRVLVIEKGGFGGQMTYSPKIENYPGFPSISGSELADKMVDQVLAQGADVAVETVSAVIPNADGTKTVTTDAGSYTAGAVILATGAKHRLLGVPNETKFVGDGISFCAVCDGAFYEGKDVIVVGGGNSALQEALLLAETSKSVTVVQNLDFFTGEQKLVDLLTSKTNVTVRFGCTVKEFVGDDTLGGMIVTDTHTGDEKTLFADGVFVAIGLAPENEAFADVVLLEDGYIVGADDCGTTAEGIFTAGDCRLKAVRQVATAVSDGAISALSACAYLDCLRAHA
ncbi:MAG: FAD-dependent oxidoreductase [Clostridia bacterium]|nr:FAD-dependent oxidoreductase [Clostridia bacterium]